MNDIFVPYETGLTRLLDLLDSEHPRYADVSIHQQRLQESVSQARRYGDIDALRHARAQIVDSLNRITQELLDVPFNVLCESVIQQPSEIHTTPSVTAPPLIDIYPDRRNIPPAHTAHSPDDAGGGPVFDSQMALFSVDKSTVFVNLKSTHLTIER
jgi:hypothetical protein